MKYLILTPFAALCLSACAPGNPVSILPPPVEVSQATLVDEKALSLAAKTLTALAKTASATVRLSEAVGCADGGLCLRAGTPRALRIADLLDKSRDAITAATSLRDAPTYAAAIAEAEALIDSLSAAIPGE